MIEKILGWIVNGIVGVFLFGLMAHYVYGLLAKHGLSIILAIAFIAFIGLVVGVISNEALSHEK